MKKKLLSFILTFAFILTAGLCLTACSETETRYHYTIIGAEHLYVEVSPMTSDDKGEYVSMGEELSLRFFAKEGWEIDGTLTLKVNDTAVEWTNTEDGRYEYKFTPTGDFTLEVVGTIQEKYCDITFVKEDFGPDVLGLDGLFIRYANGAEYPISSFLNSPSLSHKSIKYGETLDFYVYTKGYSIEPNLNYINNVEFYKDETKNEYGYHYLLEVFDNKEIKVDSPHRVYREFVTRNDESVSASIVGNLNTGENIDEVKIIAYTNNTNEEAVITTLTVELANDVPAEVLDALELKINDEKQTVAFHAGENVITLKPAYEYNNAWDPYRYKIDINFYRISYFPAISNP